METEYNGIRISHPGHASFVVEASGKIVYLDPFVFSQEPKKADLILATHDHYDHFGDISKIRRETTRVVGPAACKGTTDTVRPGDELDLGWAKVEVVPAYNINKRFHPKDAGVGYVLELAGTRIYHAGDTDNIPEMKHIRVDVAMLPIGGTYTMNASEAADAAASMAPKFVIPMHYNHIPGTEADPLEFKADVEKRTSGATEVRVI